MLQPLGMENTDLSNTSNNGLIQFDILNIWKEMTQQLFSQSYNILSQAQNRSCKTLYLTICFGLVDGWVSMPVFAE